MVFEELLIAFELEPFQTLLDIAAVTIRLLCPVYESRANMSRLPVAFVGKKLRCCRNSNDTSQRMVTFVTEGDLSAPIYECSARSTGSW